MAYDVSVRQYLQGQGVQSNDIGYDKASGNVTVRGQNFYKPELNTAGTTYSNKQNLDNAYKTYRSSLPVIQPDGTSSNSAYGSGSGNTETQQQVTQPSQTQQLSDQYVKSAQTPYVNPYTQTIADIMKQVDAARQATSAPVDPYSSAQYIAAQAQQQKVATQNNRISQESMGQSGFGRSSNLAERVQRNQNDANDYLATQIVPQIVSQIQAQKQQEYQNSLSQLNPYFQLSQQSDNSHQNDLNNLKNVLDTLYGREDTKFNQDISTQGVDLQKQGLGIQQQGVDIQKDNFGLQKDNAELNKVQVMANLTGLLPNGTPTNAKQQQDLQNEWAVADQLGAITPKLASLYKIPVGTPTRQAKEFAQTLAIQQQQANTSAASAANSAASAAASQSLAQQRFDWDKDASNPDNIYKAAQIKEMESNKNTSPELTKELDGIYTGISSGQLTKADAIAEINDKVRVGLLSSTDAAQMLAVVNSTQSKAPNVTPKLTQDQIDGFGGSNPQDLNSAQLEKLWKTDPSGKAAGRPSLDWASWYRDPRGRVGGVSYEDWKLDFGPQLLPSK